MMDKQKVENKFIYFISLLGMVMILVLIAYFFFCVMLKWILWIMRNIPMLEKMEMQVLW